MKKLWIELALVVVVVSVANTVLQWWIWTPHHQPMPPGYYLQTDGHYWRWYALERKGWWTNEAEFESRTDAYKNANNVAKINSRHHEWKDAP